MRIKTLRERRPDFCHTPRKSRRAKFARRKSVPYTSRITANCRTGTSFGSPKRIVYNLPFIRTHKRIPLALDDHIYNLRREKLKQIEALGQAIYRSKFEFTHTHDQILAEYTPKTAEELEQARVNVRVAGRIMAIRLMGKAGFAHLQQDGKRLQIYVKKDAVGDKGFELYKLLDLADHIA